MHTAFLEAAAATARARPRPGDGFATRQMPFRLQASWVDSAEDLRRVQRLRSSLRRRDGSAPAPRQRHAARPRRRPIRRVLRPPHVRAVLPGEESGEVVGTYRVLTPEAARRAGGYYSETEFDLDRLAPLRPRMAELGRSCIHPDWRTGGTILALWSALGEFMVLHGLDVAFGCASIDMSDDGHAAASLWRQLSMHLAPAQRRVRPLHPLALDALRDDLNVETPALIRGYLRCGAELLGPPAQDPDFGTADLPMLMTLDGLPRRHRRHFLGESDA